MEVKTFFTLLFVLLTVGILASAITETGVPTFSAVTFGSGAVVSGANTSVIIGTPITIKTAPLTGGNQENATYIGYWRDTFIPICTTIGCPFYVTAKGTSDPGWTNLWGLADLMGQIGSMVFAFFGWLWGGLLFAIAIFGYFTGIGTFINGSLKMPEPLGIMFLLGITFLWLFLVLEVVRRVIGAIQGR